jgi:hypothetical protein
MRTARGFSRLDEFVANVKSVCVFVWYVGLAFGVVFAMAVWFGPVGISWLDWMNVIWYSVKYEVSLDQVHMGTKPRDCDWGHAPLGDKGCHFKAVVVAYNAAGYMVGVDDAPKTPALDTTGLTPVPNQLLPANLKIKSVGVRWTKVTD